MASDGTPIPGYEIVPKRQDRPFGDIVSDNVASNLTLNIPGAITDRSKVFLAMCVCIFAQTGVIIANAFIVYRLQWLRAGKIVAAYGYPVWASGTLAISTGTSICGWVVESSTWKATLRPEKDSESRAPTRIVIFQKAIPEQDMLAYALQPIPPGGDFRVSVRLFPPTSESPSKEETRLAEIRSWITVAGAVLALSGFVCQNIGTRELHWSAGLLQLSATFTSTLVRAYLRMKVGNTPRITGSETTRNEITRLDRGFSACHLATELVGYECYLPMAYTRSQGVVRDIASSLLSITDQIDRFFQKTVGLSRNLRATLTFQT